MADQDFDSDLFVTFTTGDTSLVYQLATDVETKGSVEITSEPGVTGRIGPRIPRTVSCKITYLTLDAIDSEEGPFLPVVQGGEVIDLLTRSKEEQHRRLDDLIGKQVKIAARAIPPGPFIWVVESVRARDDLKEENTFDGELTAVQIIGGGEATPTLGKIRIPAITFAPIGTIDFGPVGPPIPEGFVASPIGADHKCVRKGGIIPTTKKAARAVNKFFGIGSALGSAGDFIASGASALGEGALLGVGGVKTAYNSLVDVAENIRGKQKTALFGKC